jgi:hypothetical protein
VRPLFALSQIQRWNVLQQQVQAYRPPAAKTTILVVHLIHTHVLGRLESNMQLVVVVVKQKQVEQVVLLNYLVLFDVSSDT